MQSKVQISCALRRVLCCQYSQRSPGYESKSGYLLAWSRRSDSRGRKKNSRRKKTCPPPPRFPGVQLTRSPLTTALYYLDAWNRLDTCRIRVDGKLDLNADTCGRGQFWIRKEIVADSKISGYVWTGPLNLQLQFLALFWLDEKVTRDSSSTKHRLYKYVQKK